MNEYTAAFPSDAGEGFEWAIVEIFGHRVVAGRVREEERFGAKMLRIDVPVLRYPEPTEAEPEPAPALQGWNQQFYGGAAIFSMRPSDEATVNKMNTPFRPRQRPFLLERAPESEDVAYPVEDADDDGVCF